jgi:hypothetical protein
MEKSMTVAQIKDIDKVVLTFEHVFVIRKMDFSGIAADYASKSY